MRDEVRSGLDGPARMVFREVCCDVWFMFWGEVRYDVIELGVVWYPNFVYACLDINSNSVKPWFLNKEYVSVVSTGVEKGVCDGIQFVVVLRQESNVEVRYGGVGRVG